MFPQDYHFSDLITIIQQSGEMRRVVTTNYNSPSLHANNFHLFEANIS
jgi:hypothetical protein